MITHKLINNNRLIIINDEDNYKSNKRRLIWISTHTPTTNARIKRVCFTAEWRRRHARAPQPAHWNESPNKKAPTCVKDKNSIVAAEFRRWHAWSLEPAHRKRAKHTWTNTIMFFCNGSSVWANGHRGAESPRTNPQWGKKSWGAVGGLARLRVFKSMCVTVVA